MTWPSIRAAQLGDLMSLRRDRVLTAAKRTWLMSEIRRQLLEHERYARKHVSETLDMIRAISDATVPQGRALSYEDVLALNVDLI